MANRFRNIHKSLDLTNEEWEAIQAKMAESQTASFSSFAREMLLTGTVRHIDFAKLKECTSQLSRLAGSINQIAKRVNETRSIYREEVDAIRQQYLEVKATVQGQLVKALRKL